MRWFSNRTSGSGQPSPSPIRPSGSSGHSSGLDGDSSALAPAILWGIVAASVAGITWGLGRAWRRWPAYLLGVPAFLVVLFVCFEYVGRLLPANV